MAVIEISTFIAAPPGRVFDLARSIDAHQQSTANTNERAIAGVTSGLIGMGQEVTWEARHFGVKQRLTVRITQFKRPDNFQDVMIAGAFKRMQHDHTFVAQSSGMMMTDQFEFESPLGILGKVADLLFLRRYMQHFLEQRNQVLKKLAESEDWKKFIPKE